MIYVYVLRSENDKRLYTGCTRDLRQRVDLHNRGKVASTAERGPLRLIYYEACINAQDAFRRRNISRPLMASVISKRDAAITSRAKEGFERTHLQEKIQFYNVARGSAGEVRSLLYVVSDNFPRAALTAEQLRVETGTVGKPVIGLLNSTVKRRSTIKGAIVALLTPISYLLSSIFS